MLPVEIDAMALSYFETGFRLMAGQWFNPLINAVNTLIAQAAGTTSGAYKGTFNGTVGATTPSTAAVTTLNASGASTLAATSVTTLTRSGVLTQGVQIAAAAGSNSQVNSTPITNSLVIVTTVTATTRAVRLPTAATGKTVQINNGTSTAVKIYPATNDRIGTAATNAVGTAIGANKGSIYVAQDAVTWRVMAGA